MADLSDEIDLAAERLGGMVMASNDDFFAAKENLLKASKPVWRDGEYTDRGKWMDGWESRRRRTPGHDWAIVRLGLPGVITGFLIDTSFFRGNFPESASVEGCSARLDATVEELCSEGTRWVEVLSKSGLKGDSHNAFALSSSLRLTHLRLNIFPDGGIARLRVYGRPVPEWNRLGRSDTGASEIDLVAVENGGAAVLCNDMFFGSRNNLVMPGRAANMGDGWETRRKRGPGHDWCILKLCAEGILRRVEVDTHHFKGNYPDTFSLEGILAGDASPEALSGGDTPWVSVIPRSKLQASCRHYYEEPLVSEGPFSHVRLNIFPDGGVSRLRIHGTVTDSGLRAARLARLSSLMPEDAAEELMACCGSRAWALALAARGPFTSLEALLGASDDVWCHHTTPADWLLAFKAHPRIGRGPNEVHQGASGLTGRRWSSQEQARAQTMTDAQRSELEAKSAIFEQRFGHIFIVCATGKSPEEILATITERMEYPPETELRAAAEEQRKITRLRLAKMVNL